ncbi:MAG: helix-turn-helix transcriptional regulator [Phycisphaera sp.]|nr:MAG: helix-turn-helix transcriptional regulator [Phycisphaera sp.]
MALEIRKASKVCQEAAIPRDGEADALWMVLQFHPFIGASVITAEGRFLWANARAKLLYLGDAEVDIAGKTFYDLFPKEWCDERIALLKQLEETGKSAVLRHIRRGRSLMVTYNKIPTPAREASRYLILIAEADEEEQIPVPDEYMVFNTGLMNLGPLNSLSKREIEVLALISRGLTTEEIAKELSRSPKTIEAHRSSVARKLGVKNRVQLAEIARKASLEIRHADLKRIGDDP